DSDPTPNPLPEAGRGSKTSGERRWPMIRFLLPLLTLAALALGLGAQPVPRQPGRDPLREALERFRSLSPGARRQQAGKRAGKRAFSPVVPRALDVAVVERGTAESADATDVVCRVRATAQGKAATTIKWLVEDGTLVKKGQRLVELDDSALR